ncbi:MAG: NAD-dependent epimerase/dehydratase family protein [Clostridia bacterium]|nr:NAD-dependent epimerase/dehydratase family protein [Clostridia bacterium]
MFLYDKEVVRKDMEEIVSRDYVPYEMLRDKTVLITGATGMLAYYFTMALMHLNLTRDYNIRVLALVRNAEKAKAKFKGFLSDEHFEIIAQDVCAPIEYAGEIDYIFHAAGACSPYFIKHDPTGIIAANTQGTVNVLELAREKKVTNIIYPSTREIYGKVEGVEFIKETDMGIFDPLDARSCYPESKRIAETILKSYLVQHGVPFTVLRIAHSYGPGMIIDSDGRVMSDFISDAVNSRNIVLKSEGLALRAFCYVTDAVSAIFLAMLKGANGEAYNLANETEPTPIRDVAGMLAELFPERNIKVIFEISGDTGSYCNYARVGLDTAKLEALGWKPEVKLRDGLRRTVVSFD